MKADYWAIFEVPDKIEPGLDVVGYVQKRIDCSSSVGATRSGGGGGPAGRLTRRDPAVPASALDPVRHQLHRAMSGETRRCVKVIVGRRRARPPKRRGRCSTCASTGWRGSAITPAGCGCWPTC